MFSLISLFVSLRKRDAEQYAMNAVSDRGAAQDVARAA